MRLASKIEELRAARRELAGSVAFVPTMGALHEGHLSLVRAARAGADSVAASIFVNPLQFAPGEDLARYPRTFEADLAALEREGVALLFAPSPEEMFPADATTFVEVGGIGDRLDGASRPGHFRGVATVVAKLFHLVAPDRAYFGQKDAAQVAVLRAMVRDLGFPVDLVVCPTVREPDGLAMSSRNRYLTAEQRVQAPALSAALQELQGAGERDPRALAALLRAKLARSPGLRVDYAELVDPATLLPVETLAKGALAAAAVWLGETRLIDNVLLGATR
jgi:pantoate--beta-alanine ligase